MEIVLVLVVLLVIAGAAFLYLRSRPGGTATGLRGGSAGPRLRGARRARVASRHDPMAVAVERHARAVDPHEAAVEEQNLQAQARVVAAELHAQQPAPVDANRAYAEPDPYADPVQEDGHVYPDPYAQPVDGRVYPAEAPDPDGVYPAQPPASAGAPPPPPRR